VDRYSLVLAGLLSVPGLSAASSVREPASPPGNRYAPFHEPRPREPGPREAREEFEEREERRDERIARVLDRARRFLGRRTISIDGRKFHWDCANYLRAAYFREFDIMHFDGAPRTRSGVRLIWYFAKRRGGIHFRKIPLPGDMIFFHQTYDSNGNRKADDYYTHIAVVEKVDPDGTITYMDRAIAGIARRRMNLYYPDVVKHPRTGKVINSHVRPRRRWDEKGAKHLSAQLFAGFATLIR
jgi:hypothetical protein